MKWIFILLFSFNLLAQVTSAQLEDKLTYNGKISWKLIQLKSKHTIFYWQPVHKDSIFLKSKDLWDQLIDEVRTPNAQISDCPHGMVRVTGNMLPPKIIVPLQNKACLDGGKWNPKYLCQNFDENYLIGKNIAGKNLNFCIDLFEYPNIQGEYPAVMASFNDAKALCKAQNKRLCNEDEWSFACESEKALPYPQGFHRYTDPTSSFPSNIKNEGGCNYDRLPLKPINIQTLLKNSRNIRAAIELDRSFNGTKAGARKACQSEFGVFDLTGNIEEWTVQVKGRSRNLHGKPSILKGGYWSPVRSRCQLSEAAHGTGHKYYQTGFRCCSDF